MNPLDAAYELELRTLAPRVLGAVTRRCGDFAAAEDAVQEALLAAVTDWPRGGVPANPGGWLFAVACRRVKDHLEAERARANREFTAAVHEAALPASPDLDDWTGDDDTLALLFTSCHPALTPASAIALTLRAVGGLSTAAIASAFVVPEATMAQRITRAKQSIQESGIPLALPPASQRDARVGQVLHVVYLMFNEGYASSSGAALLRIDLSAEAIRIARLLHRLLPGHADTRGLLALLLLTDARRQARTGPNGELIPLQEQDRTRWDRALIAEGTDLVRQAVGAGPAGSYVVQAAIAALHGAAPSVAATDWPQILALYDLLMRHSDNPMVALNRAVAVAMVHGAPAALDLLRQLEANGRLGATHRLQAVRAHLHEMAGEVDAAKRDYFAAAVRTASAAERDYLLAKAARLGQT
jgi:RNA polymerase sigma factor (sigma-70 family)